MTRLHSSGHATKLNLGAGATWKPIDGWCVVDHSTISTRKAPQAWKIPYPDGAFEAVFCSHMIEHISHFRIEQVVCEINRVLRPGGVLRLLTPNLRKLAEAYVNNDRETMAKYLAEDGSGIRSDLGPGQAFMGFIVSQGYDNYLVDSQMSELVAGYGHLYSYDFEMLSGLLRRYGFGSIEEPSIHESKIAEHKLLRTCQYDEDALHSLVVECVKTSDTRWEPERSVMRNTKYTEAKGARLHFLTPKVIAISSVFEGLAYFLYRKLRLTRRM
jgi:SAM-dependent methyltransferase